jgi:hypothetical protein
MKTAMQQHLEWLKARIDVTPQMEQILLEQEEQHIVEAYNAGLMEQGNPMDYYNKTFKQG